MGERAIVVRSLHDPNAKLLEVLLAADALRRAGVQHLTLVAPYLPYMRQDGVFRPGEPISQRVVGAALARAFDRIVTVQAHLHRVRSLAAVTRRGSSSVSGAPAIATWVKRRAPGCIVIGPDAESEPMVRAIARASGAPWSVARKERRGDRDVRVHLPDLPSCDTAVLVDDIASTGVTLAAVAGALARRGVRCEAAVVVHALFAPGAPARLREAGVRRVVTLDTIEHPTNALSCAPLLAAALRECR
jgi:ribose-phosphate pyrophosphokinase